jgi:hypothetical protein
LVYFCLRHNEWMPVCILQQKARSELISSFVVILAITLITSAFFMLVEDWNFFECIYFCTVTISTVGTQSCFWSAVLQFFTRVLPQTYG